MELGKAKKGAKGKKAAKTPPTAEEIEAQRRAAQDALRLKLKDRLTALERASKINRLKVDEGWRELMRVRKVESLRNDLEQLAMQHELRMDAKDVIISALDRELDISGEQYTDAQRSHLYNVDALLEVQKASIERLEAAFSATFEELKQTHAVEQSEMTKNHDVLKQSLLDAMSTMEAEFRIFDAQRRQEFEETYQSEKDKHTEDFNVQKITLEAALDDLKTSATEAYTQYRSATDQTQSQYQKLLERDKLNQKRLLLQNQHIKKLNDQINTWKAKISASKTEHVQKLSELSEERAQIQKHFKRLRAKISKFRQKERERLAGLMQSARGTIDTLEQHLSVGENTVKLANLCKKLENENEHRQPFYLDAECDSTTMFAELDIIPQMDRFYQRYNKVFLETVALRKEEERLEDENTKLKSILQQYLTAITVSDDALSQDNPLLTVTSLKPR
ncbi:hypothetical protein RCL1_002890 [Eukaryota sp. TZLM3-RCL]